MANGRGARDLLELRTLRTTNSLDGVSGLGSDRHRALIGEILEFYKDDERVRAVAVFGSVAAGTWHELSDVDLDVVIEDGAVVAPAVEVEALFGSRAASVRVSDDSAEVVVDSLEGISMR